VPRQILGAVMSYLVGPRLHFAGRFTADVSTVNNDPQHFKDPNQPPGPGWNPRGTGSWKVDGCTVTSAVFADGTVARTAANDPVVGASIVQAGQARLVDLDSEQQLVSQIWGLGLSLTRTPGGSPAFAGAFKAAAFSDLWPGRVSTNGQGSDLTMSAFYQSVLTEVAWADLFGSRLLTELKQASAAGLLSIKFNVDGFDLTRHVGRIVGTIGPALAGEPAHFVVGRQCMPRDGGPVGYFPAVVDQQRRKLVADFGNALQTTSFGGPFDSTLNLQIGLNSGDQFTSLGRVPIGPAGWYEQTAGICELPSDRPLTAAEMEQLATTPIAVAQQAAGGGGATVIASEGLDGLHVRADDFVYRMSANDTATVTLRASRFGQPLPNAACSLAFDDSQLQQGGGDPTVGGPPAGLTFPASVTTDAQGVASFQLSAGSIGKPRDYIDGQVYGVRYQLAQSDPNAGGYFDAYDFISVLVWTDFVIPQEPTWQDNVGPILTQYKKLYPVMAGFVNLGDYSSVVAHKAQMQDVFTRPQEDAHYMPVTRDLSPAKRQMILNWLQTTGNAGQPNLGGPAVAAVHAAAVAVAAREAEPEGDLVAQLGGKSAALRDRRAPEQPPPVVKRPV
jgi:hypothetical protein